jgi:hypothetical protein
MARPKSAATRLAAEQAAQESAARRIAEAHTQRNAALDADEDSRAAELLAEIRQLELIATGHTDKIRRLQEAAEREATEEQARRHAAHIKRVEKKLTELREHGTELALAVATGEAKFREMIDTIGEIQTMWPFQAHNLVAAFLTPGRIVEILQYELYRIGARPMLLGGQREGPQAGLNYPGGKDPRIELMGQPNLIEPFTSVLERGTKLASEIMRTGRSTANVNGAPAPVAAVPPAVEIPAAPAAASQPNGNPFDASGAAVRERTPSEERLGSLLAEMARLADDISPEGEAKYLRIQEEVAAVQDQINAERGVIR